MAMRPLTLEKLECAETRVASVWRACRDLGEPVTVAELEALGLGTPEQIHGCIGSLVLKGWLVPAERRGLYFAYAACTSNDGTEAKEKTDSGIALIRARKALTQAAAKAGLARRTGLAQQMSQALFELEKELREIRDSIGGRAR